MSPRRFSLAPEQWPSADRDLMDQLFAGGGLLDDRGLLAHVRPASRTNLTQTYARWMGWVMKEAPEALEESPVPRVTPERFRGWLLSLERLAPNSQHSLASSLLWLLKAAAPEGDWSRQAQVLHRLWRRSLEHRSTRKDGRVLSTALILQAALRLSREHGQGAAPRSREAAKARRNAAMVAFLAVMPIRRRGFCELELGGSFLVEGARMFVRLDPVLTKTAEPWEAAVPEVLRPILADYLAWVRPWFVARGRPCGDRFWLNDWGRPYTADRLSTHVSRVTQDLVGTPIPPHFFRDCVATTLAMHSPESARLTRGVLGHSSVRTAERHYNQATALEAGRRYADVLARFADKAP